VTTSRLSILCLSFWCSRNQVRRQKTIQLSSSWYYVTAILMVNFISTRLVKYWGVPWTEIVDSFLSRFSISEFESSAPSYRSELYPTILLCSWWKQTFSFEKFNPSHSCSEWNVALDSCSLHCADHVLLIDVIWTENIHSLAWNEKSLSYNSIMFPSRRKGKLKFVMSPAFVPETGSNRQDRGFSNLRRIENDQSRVKISYLVEIECKFNKCAATLFSVSWSSAAFPLYPGTGTQSSPQAHTVE